MSPLERLRGLLIAWRSAGIERSRAAWRGAGADPDHASRELAAHDRAVRLARAALGTGEARALLEECTKLGLLDALDLRVWLAHLADAAREEVLERRGAPGLPALDEDVVLAQTAERLSLGALLGEPERWLEAPRREVLTARLHELDRRRHEPTAEADAAAARVLARGPAVEAMAVDAEGWLDATEDATREALERAAHALGAPKDADPRLLHVLRAAPLDALFPGAGRVARLARALAPLGTDARAGARIRFEERHEPSLRPALALVEPPRRVVVGLPVIELGLASELTALEALGQGLGASLVSPALGVEHRTLAHAEVPIALGELGALLFTEAGFVTRQLGLDGRTARTVQAVGTHRALVRGRLALARWACRARGAAVTSAEAHALAARALGSRAEWPAGPLLFSTAASPELESAARAAMLAASLTAALRERHDEDYFRNPRAAETLAGASARGARLGLAAWLEELGAPPTPATAVTQALAQARAALR
jgi:hypothetical protein